MMCTIYAREAVGAAGRGGGVRRSGWPVARWAGGACSLRALAPNARRAPIHPLPYPLIH